MPVAQFCKTGTGTTPLRAEGARFYGGSIPWVKSGELAQGIVRSTEETLTSEAVETVNIRLIEPGALLVALYGATVGQVAELGIRATTNQAVCHVIPDPKIADRRYMYYALRRQGPIWIRQRVGGAQPNISQGIVKQTQIPLPPLSEQRRIASILDQADGIRRRREEGLRLTDELLRSTFLDMFGDPAVNPKRWLRQPLQSLEVSDGIKCGPFGTQLSKSEFQTSGVPLWGIKHVNSHFRTPTDEYISDAKAEDLAAYSLRPRDIVMTRKGTVGNCSIYPDDLPTGMMHSDLLRLRLDERKALPEFLSHQFLINSDVQFQLSRISAGAIMPGVNVTKLKRLFVLLPPVSEQRAFADAAMTIANQRARRADGLLATTSLFSCLVQRAFRGEL